MSKTEDGIYSLLFYGIIFIAIGLGGVLCSLLGWKIGDGIAYMVLGFLMLIAFCFLKNKYEHKRRKK